MTLVVFRQAFENTFRDGPGPRATERMRTRMAQAGVDFSRPLLPAYAPEVWARCLTIASEELYPGQAPEAAHTDLGLNSFRSFTQGLVGQAMGQLMRVIGPKRTLQRLDRFFKNGQSEVTLRFTDVGPNECEVALAPLLGTPYYFRGMLLGGAELLGLKQPEVEVTQQADGGAAFRVRWA